MSKIPLFESIERGATFGGPEQCYRFGLTRIWEPSKGVVSWTMLNPSTATDTKDDPTVARTQSFARAWGYGGVVVTNLFALRSTDPGNLYSHNAPEGDPHNLGWIEEAAANAKLVIVAWGIHGAYMNRGMRVAKLLAGRGLELRCLGQTFAGYPKHPLYIKGDTPHVPFVLR